MNNEYIQQSKLLEKRWSETGLLEGIQDPSTRAATAVLLEHQKLINENSTDTSDISRFTRISIPLVRRIYPNLIANKIVSVQPLLGPTGLVFYLRFRYSSNKGATRGGSNNGGFPGDDANSLMQTADGTVNLDTKYTSQEVANEETSTDDGADVTSIFDALEHTPIIGGTVTGSIYDGSELVQNFVVSSSGVFTFTDVGSPSVKVTAATLNLTTGEMVFTWNSAPGENHATVSYEYNMECNQDIPEINLAVESESITSVTRKLKASWSPESSQDLRSMHNLDAQTEILGVLAQEINLEIDREIIDDLRSNAGTILAWDFKTALGTNIKEKYESLYVKLAEASAVIHRKTMRAAANWIVTSPEIATIFETSTAGFAPSPSETFTSSLGVQYVGSVGTRWKVYKDPAFKANQILFGYKGDNYMDSGYFYCPYVPLTQTPVVVDPDSFCPRVGIMTRYGKKMLREGAKFYGRMTIANFQVS